MFNGVAAILILKSCNLDMLIKWENKKYCTVGIFQHPITKCLERDKVDTLDTQLHECSLYWPGTDTLIKGGGDKLVLFAQIPF